jgi:hypothetical protein
MRITELQQSLFDLARFEIEPVANDNAIGDWDWDTADTYLLPNSKSREQFDTDRLLPNSQPPSSLISEANAVRSLINEPPPARSIDADLLPKSREQYLQDPPTKLLPNLAIREQLEDGQHVPGYSIVLVKGQRYLLHHSKSNKYYPTDRGWFDIKPKGGIDYLYTRWRDGQKQKSRCLGRIDRLE